jgi:hypothetical protein
MQQGQQLFFSILFDNESMTVAIFIWNVQRCQHHNRENSQSAGRLNGNRSSLHQFIA